MGIAQNIEALLHEHDMTPEGFAALVDVSPATVSRWRRGMGMRQATVRRICEVFGLQADDLLSDSGGLAARRWGDAARHTSSVPLLTCREALARVESPSKATLPVSHANGDAVKEGADETLVEVPAFVIERHPGAFALAVEDCAMDRVIPPGSNVLVDPDLAPGNTAIVAVVITDVRTHDLRASRTKDAQTADAHDGHAETPASAVAHDGHPRATGQPAATLRRLVRGNDTVVLSTESTQTREDVVIPGSGRTVQVIGTVVWFQAAGLLA